MAQIIRIGSVGDIVNTLVNHFDNNNIEEICVCFKGKDNNNYGTWSTNGTFLIELVWLKH